VKRTAFYNILSAIVFCLIWQLLSLVVQSKFFPGPIDVASAFYDMLVVGDLQKKRLWYHAFISVERVIVGLTASCIIAIPLGILLGMRQQVYDSTKSVIDSLRFIPPIAWIPIAIVLLRGFTRYTFLIGIGAFFTLLMTTMIGIRRVDPLLVEVMKSFGASKMRIVWKVVIPGALPEILGGIRIALGLGWMSIVAAEMIGGENLGVGRMMVNYAELMRLDVVLVGMVVIGMIGYSMNEAFVALERRLFRWRKSIEI
jgi:ABC-type nitrate/sulfonate/bicarbonate transport system permease component